MFCINIGWKEFKVDLPSLDTHMRLSLGEKYAGITAHSLLEIYFRERVSEEELMRIDEYMAALTEEGERRKISFREQREGVIERTKGRLVYADLTQLTPAERKVLMNLPLSTEEIDSLI